MRVALLCLLVVACVQLPMRPVCEGDCALKDSSFIFDVVNGTAHACLKNVTSEDRHDFQVRLKVTNRENAPLTGMEAIITGDKKVGKEPAYWRADVLDEPLEVNESRNISVVFWSKAIGNPRNVYLYAVNETQGARRRVGAFKISLC